MSNKYEIISIGNTQGISGAWQGSHVHTTQTPTHIYGSHVHTTQMPNHTHGYDRKRLIEEELRKLNHDIKSWEGYIASANGYMPLAELQERFNHLKFMKLRRQGLMAELVKGD